MARLLPVRLEFGSATLASVGVAESSLLLARALHFSAGGGAERRGDGCQLPRADQCTIQEESRDPGDASSSPDHLKISLGVSNLDSFFVGKNFSFESLP